MVDKIRNFLASPAGKGASIVVAVIGLMVVVWVAKSSFSSDIVSYSRDRKFIDAKTGKSFSYQISPGETYPVPAPSGEKSGYPAELCYWTKDGKLRSEPYPVLINLWVKKPGPTFCPDCGRLVIAHNPVPTASSKPPPTQAEYASRPSAFVAEPR